MYAHKVGVKPEMCQATDRYNRLHADIMAKTLLDQNLVEYVISDVTNTHVDIIEESQPLEVAKRLVQAGLKVTMRDRSAIVELVRRTYGRMFDYTTCDGDESSSNATMGNPLSSYAKT